MNVGRAAGVALLSLVDALVPTVVAGVLVFLSIPYWGTDAVDPLVLSAGVAAFAFVGTLTVGTVTTVLGYGPFPATKAAKWVWRVSSWDFGTRRKR